MPEIQLGAPYSTTWSSSYFPWKNSFEGYETRDDLSWNKGVHQFKFGFSWLHAPKNQELQANTQGTAVFNNSSFSKILRSTSPSAMSPPLPSSSTSRANIGFRTTMASTSLTTGTSSPG